MYKLTAAFAALAIATAALAADDGAEALARKLGKTFPGLSADDVRATPAKGIYEVTVNTGRGTVIGHATEDGQYFIDGDLIEVSTGRSLTEDRRRSERLSRLASMGDNKMVVFTAPQEKHVLTVFTDIDCGYCRKLHREMDQYHARGISVRYLFYPRSGPNTPSFSKAEAVWCSEDRNAAMTQAKNGQNVKADSCANPVQQHFDLGREFGIRGTPALVLDDGSIQPGYVPAARLAGILAGG